MDVTLKNGKKFIITLRAWDGTNWMPDCAGDVLDTWQPETQADLDWLVDDCDRFNTGQDLDWLVEDCDNFNAGQDLDWLEHCPGWQEVSLDVREVN